MVRHHRKVSTENGHGTHVAGTIAAVGDNSPNGNAAAIQKATVATRFH